MNRRSFLSSVSALVALFVGRSAFGGVVDSRKLDVPERNVPPVLGWIVKGGPTGYYILGNLLHDPADDLRDAGALYEIRTDFFEQVGGNPAVEVGCKAVACWDYPGRCWQLSWIRI